MVWGEVMAAGEAELSIVNQVWVDRHLCWRIGAGERVDPSIDRGHVKTLTNRLRAADSDDHRICAASLGELLHTRYRIGCGGIDRIVSAQFACLFKSRPDRITHDHPRAAVARDL